MNRHLNLNRILCYLWFLGSLATPGARADLALQVGQNFTGSTFGRDSSASPADANGAIGPQHFVEFVNGRFSVYDKASGTRVQTMTDLEFWSAAGLSVPSTQAVSDPRLAYDADSQRWFASMIDVSASSRRQTSNHFLLAVSQTADPTGAWQGVRFGADPNNLLFADFPTLGLDRNAVYLSGDLFDQFGNAVGPTLVSIPKSGLLLNPPDISNRFSFGTLAYTDRGDILQPAITSGTASSPEMVVAVGDLGLDSQNHATLVLSTVQNAAGTSPDLTAAVVLNVPGYSVPIDPVQPDGSNNLDNGDARLGASTRRVGDVLYVTHAVEVDNRAAVRWYRIDASQGTLLDSGTITDPNLELFYPSIAANEAGTVVIACNGCNGSTYVGSYATTGQLVNGSLTFGALTLLKSGSASYQYPDRTGVSLWGDYSTTSPDPSDPNRFWTIQMIASGSSTWVTQITELITGPSPGPRITAVATPQGLVVSWPATDGGYQLESSPSLGPTATWTPVAQTPTLQNNVNSVTLDATNAQAFLRLHSTSSSGQSQN